MTIFAALELSLLFVCIWGFIAILLTGQIGIPVVISCIAALIGAYYLRRRNWRPSALITNSLAAFVLLMAGSIFATTLNLLSATVHLFLFLQVTKYATRKQLSEIRWCYLISLFNIIGASVITTTFTFGPVLVVYIFLILISLRLFVVAQEYERASRAAAHAIINLHTPNSKPTPRLQHRMRNALVVFLQRPKRQPADNPTALAALNQIRMPRGIISSGLALTIITIGLTAALFSIIPRLATQNLFQTLAPPKEDSSVSAFSENVEFGAFTEIQLDDKIALFVEPKGSQRPTYVRMRGVALDQFDGKTWRRSGGSFPHSGRYDYQPIFTTRLYPNTYTFRLLQPAGMTNFLFGDSFPISIHVPPLYTYHVDRMAQSVWLAEALPKDFQYEVKCMPENLSLRQDPITLKPARPAMQLMPDVSRLHLNDDADDPMEAMLRFFNSIDNSIELEDKLTSSDAEETEESTHTRDEKFRRYRRYRRSYKPPTSTELLHRYLHRCLELPDNLRTGRVPDLAAEWTEDSATTFTKAMAIENRLRTTYEYTLTPKASGNYIESFLFDVQAGHCEYFATSMAVLLRNIGIPSRIVNGFYSTEWNALSGNFTVRQKDAHSWVEAWMGDNYGWMTFDPTPPSGVARRADRGAIAETLSRMSDAIRMRWYRYVIDYSFSDQVNAIRYLSRLRERFVHAIKKIHIPGITDKKAATIEQSGLYSEIDWRPIAAAAGIILLLLTWQITRWTIRRRRPQFSVVKFYDDLLKALAQRGITIRPGETPQEFAARITTMRPDWAAFTLATNLYYQKKYNMPQTTQRPAQKNKHVIYNLTEAQIHDLSALKKTITQKQPPDNTPRP